MIVKMVMFAVALETGGVLGLPKMLIDPRRPEVMSPEARSLRFPVLCHWYLLIATPLLSKLVNVHSGQKKLNPRHKKRDAKEIGTCKVCWK